MKTVISSKQDVHETVVMNKIKSPTLEETLEKPVEEKDEKSYNWIDISKSPIMEESRCAMSVITLSLSPLSPSPEAIVSAKSCYIAEHLVQTTTCVKEKKHAHKLLVPMIQKVQCKKQQKNSKCWMFKFKGKLEEKRKLDVQQNATVDKDNQVTIHVFDLVAESEIQVVFEHWKKNKCPKSWMFKFNNSLEMHDGAMTRKQVYFICMTVCGEKVFSCITCDLVQLDQQKMVSTKLWRTKTHEEAKHKHFSESVMVHIGRTLPIISELVLLKLVVICYIPRGYGLSGVVSDFSVDAEGMCTREVGQLLHESSFVSLGQCGTESPLFCVALLEKQDTAASSSQLIQLVELVCYKCDEAITSVPQVEKDGEPEYAVTRQCGVAAALFTACSVALALAEF
ncbi:hypothetical protein Bca4012_062743 [Brassica carinata]|uniref:Uncharacterized protein n=1 Tax=Brassica carinata TaxID=52824 RepID=A0A8X7V6A1_BRACI|nr:hypothetical protein Bca52824_032418 [Brassica carinata]